MKNFNKNKTGYVVAPNISLVSTNLSGGKLYRCRIQKNGTRFENYETSIKRAKSWLSKMKAS